MWNTDSYRVKPGSKVRLKDQPTKDDGGLTKEQGAAELEELKTRLIALDELLYADARHALLLIFQGMDTSGKDSTVRSVFSGVNPSGNDVANFKLPSSLELSHDFLWRAHARVPARGSMTIFNRSHYEDVLVARVNGLAPEEPWQARFGHTNAFERMRHDEVPTIRKFFLHISPGSGRALESAGPEKRWKFNQRPQFCAAVVGVHAGLRDGCGSAQRAQLVHHPRRAYVVPRPRGGPGAG